MKLQTRAFLLGLLPTLLVAMVLTAYHLYSRLVDLEHTMAQQGMAITRQLAASAEYGVFSGNTTVLGKLLDQAVAQPDVESAMVIWPDQARLTRGEAIGRLPSLINKGSQWQEGSRAWFVHPVQLTPLDENDPYIENRKTVNAPLAWVAVGIDLHRKQVLVQRLLGTSLTITFLGLAFAILLIYLLALSGLRPLLDIVATVRRISSGSFGTRMDVTARAPELRALQAMVNQMSESLHSYQQEMEAKVSRVTAELEHKKREAEQASLAKSRFLAVASHDLRQPMHAIGLYVESLKPQMHGREAGDTLDKIERCILGTVELFNAILDVTKLDAGVVRPSLAPVCIRKLLLNLADEFAADADKKGLSLCVRAPDVWIESDAILLERIVRNLLSNAVRHTGRGGVLLSARPCQGKLRLQVWDTGYGIAPENQSRVFDEFYQVETHTPVDAPHGLGLGLAIVRRLARLLGYPLQLHSRVGHGTVFSLDIPLLACPPMDIARSAASNGARLQGCVAVVDDEPGVLDALSHLLQRWGVDVRPFHSLHQLVQELQTAPDLVLADYQLRDGETGLMVASEVQKRWGRHIPVVLITGDTRTETIQVLRQSGFPVLHKPVRADQLRGLLEMLLRERSVRQIDA